MTADVTRLAGESRSSIAAVCRALEVPRSSVYAAYTLTARVSANECCDSLGKKRRMKIGAAARSLESRIRIRSDAILRPARGGSEGSMDQTGMRVRLGKVAPLGHLLDVLRHKSQRCVYLA